MNVYDCTIIQFLHWNRVTKCIVRGNAFCLGAIKCIVGLFFVSEMVDTVDSAVFSFFWNAYF
jgi:hypothetical protein